MVAVLSVVTAMLFLYIDWRLRSLKSRDSGSEITNQEITCDVEDYPNEPPDGMSLHKGHCWTTTQDQGTYRIGVDGLISQLLGKVDAVSRPNIGTQVKEGDTILRIRHGDRTLSLRSPIAGTVIGINEELNPRTLKARPYTDGWLCEIRPAADTDALGDAVDQRTATDWYRAEFQRAGEFLSAMPVHSHRLVYDSHSGAPILDSALDNASPADWTRFQEAFL